MERLEPKKQIYSVNQVNSYIKQIFEGDFILRSLSVKGEVSNCKYHSSGHIYFSLKDGSSVISCVMFSSAAASGLKFRLEDGKQVVVTGSISVYEASGRYQLYARKIEEEGTGDLFRKFEELKARLEEAGFFAEQYKKPIPAYGYRIGVVTSETGAVIRDIYNVSSRRNPFVQIYLYPAKVQGEGAAQTIAAGIRKLDTLGLDVIIIGRGGGSIEDLWAFNEETVARAIFQCATPVISAVGHETDFTIADFTADMRAPTPSAAAELAVFDYAAFQKELADYQYTLKRELMNKLSEKKNRTETYRLLIAGLSPQTQLYQKMQKLDDIRDKLDSQIAEKIRQEKEKNGISKEWLARCMQEKLIQRKHHLALVSERLSGLSPLRRLQEGYAYVNLHGTTLRSVEQLNVKDEITVVLSDGSAKATVEEIERQTL